MNTKSNWLWVCLLLSGLSHAQIYHIDGEFDGCEWGKIYPIFGHHLLLECTEYKYFYRNSPEVEAEGRFVIAIGGEAINARIIPGRIINTSTSNPFEGCKKGQQVNFANGLTLVCAEDSTDRAPKQGTQSRLKSRIKSRLLQTTPRSQPIEVRIIMVEGRSPKVFINGRRYSGQLTRTPPQN